MAENAVHAAADPNGFLLAVRVDLHVRILDSDPILRFEFGSLIIIRHHDSDFAKPVAVRVDIPQVGLAVWAPVGGEEQDCRTLRGKGLAASRVVKITFVPLLGA